MDLPLDVLKLILEYDGRIKYSHKERIYVNIIHKYDWRYSVVGHKMGEHCALVKNLRYGNLKYFVNIYYKTKEIGLLFCKILLLS